MKPEVDGLLRKHGKLTAREIAKLLGLARKEVNSFLYANLQDYTKDDEHEWALAATSELKLQLPAGWTTASDFEMALVQAHPGQPPTTSILVFEEGCKLKFDCIARLLAMANHAVRQNAKVVLDFTASAGTKGYLNRAGFFDRLAEDVVVLPARPTCSTAVTYLGQSETLMEIAEIRVDDDNVELVEYLCDKFVFYSSDDYKAAAVAMFGELVSNVHDHSEATTGFAGFQKYGGSEPHIQTVVSDDGEGIATTLRTTLEKNHPALFRKYGVRSTQSDMDLVAHAVSQGNVSRFGTEGGRGLGLKSSHSSTKRFNARFSIRQQDFSLTFAYRSGKLVLVKKHPNLVPLQGTNICFDFFLA